MTQEELRAKLETNDIEGSTIEQLILVRDAARDAQAQLHRSCNELRNYNVVGGYFTTTDEVRDRINECLQAMADERAIYGAFVSRVREEIIKRVDATDK